MPSKADIIAIFKAVAVLQNQADPLRRERAEVMLTKRYSEKQAERLVEYLQVAITPVAQ